MRNKCLKRIVAVFLAALMCLASTVAVFAEEEVPEYDEVIAIIHTNDVHGGIEVEPYVKAIADQMKASGDYSLVLTASAGDVYSGGDAVAGYYKGELIPAIMDQVYDVIAPGNNDFNDGIAQNLLLTALYKHAKTICANLVFKDGIDLPDYAAAYKASIGNEDFAALYDGVELNGDALDFSALNLQKTTAETSPYAATEIFTTAKGTKLGLFGLSCTGGQMAGKLVGAGSIDAAKNAVAELKKQNADVIVGLAHTGWMGEGAETPAQANDTNAWLLASAVQDMDALIDSHTHVTINEGAGCYVGDNKVLVNQAYWHGEDIGLMKFYLKDGKVVAKTAELLTGEDYKKLTPDATVEAMVDAAIARAMADAGPTLVTTPYYLNADSSSGTSTARGAETNMGDFITDVILKAASEKRSTNYDFTFYPGYCLRKSIAAETMMTKVDIASIISFPVPLVEQEYSAQDIVDLVTRTLQQVAPEYFKASTFNQYSGLEIRYINTNGIGRPVSIKVGDDLIYDVEKGGIQVDSSWKALGVRGIDPNEHVDIDTFDPADVICKDVNEVRALICGYLGTHTLGTDFTIYPNEAVPAKRIVEVQPNKAIVTFMIDQLEKAQKDAEDKVLNDAKEAAAKIIATINPSDYVPSDQEKVTNAIAAAQDAINAATKPEDVAAAIQTLNEALAACKTAAAELADAKKAAIDAINKYVDANKAKIFASDFVNVELCALQNILKIEGLEKLESIHLGVDAVKKVVNKYVRIKAETVAAQNLIVKNLKAKSKKAKFTVSWTKNAKANAYQVQYKMKGAKKYATLTNATKKNVVKTGRLKKGKLYIFRVRTCKTVNGKVVYGKWTTSKAVKCK